MARRKKSDGTKAGNKGLNSKLKNRVKKASKGSSGTTVIEALVARGRRTATNKPSKRGGRGINPRTGRVDRAL